MQVLAIAAAFCGILVWLYRRDERRVRHDRAAFFEEALELFETARVTQDGMHFPVLTGRYCGRSVRIEPVVDSVAVRKLPSLLLLVTVAAPLPVGGLFDMLIRGSNTEFYSGWWQLDHELPRPDGWPEQAGVRCSGPDAVPPIGAVERHIAAFHRPDAKELVIGPGGVRIVFLHDEALRSQYLLFRQASFEKTRLSADAARELLDLAIAIHADVADTAAPQSGRQKESGAWLDRAS